MKKTLAYMVTAILLGTIVMLFPVLMLYPSEVSTARGLASVPVPQPAPPPETYAEDMQKAAPEVETVGVTPFPLSLAYAGVIFIVGFVVGLGVAQYYKRRIV